MEYNEVRMISVFPNSFIQKTKVILCIESCF